MHLLEKGEAMNEDSLCIGGPLDGKRITKPEDLYIFETLIEFPPYKIIPKAYDISKTVAEFKTIYYKAEYLYDSINKNKYKVFVAQDNNTKGIIERLIEGYKP